MSKRAEQFTQPASSVPRGRNGAVMSFGRRALHPPALALLVDCSPDEPPHVAGAAAPGIISVRATSSVSSIVHVLVPTNEGEAARRAGMSFDSKISWIVVSSDTGAFRVCRTEPRHFAGCSRWSVCAPGSVGGSHGIPSLVEAKLGCGSVPTSMRRLIEPHGVLRIWSLRGVGSSHRDGAGVLNYEGILNASPAWELRVCGVPNSGFHERPHPLTQEHRVSGTRGLACGGSRRLHISSVEADQMPVLIFYATNWTQVFYWLCSRGRSSADLRFAWSTASQTYSSP
ncbi:hypothetical protein B0H19DRAFT_1057160 [Mycena capillaripes]|nr:hypothetical protein B0H19DRAFT_1080224 [Mycena capillaripes]KAJ6594954.1 hypothetical protein B0H19DRAFT_1057160 [Mycena capillaripes]